MVDGVDVEISTQTKQPRTLCEDTSLNASQTIQEGNYKDFSKMTPEEVLEWWIK